MALLDKQSLPPGFLTELEQTVWPYLKEKFNPIVWKWYDDNKDDKFTTFLKFYTIRLGSFGIVEFAIKHIFGDRPPVL